MYSENFPTRRELLRETKIETPSICPHKKMLSLSSCAGRLLPVFEPPCPWRRKEAEGSRTFLWALVDGRRCRRSSLRVSACPTGRRWALRCWTRRLFREEKVLHERCFVVFLEENLFRPNSSRTFHSPGTVPSYSLLDVSGRKCECPEGDEGFGDKRSAFSGPIMCFPLRLGVFHFSKRVFVDVFCEEREREEPLSSRAPPPFWSQLPFSGPLP